MSEAAILEPRVPLKEVTSPPGSQEESIPMSVPSQCMNSTVRIRFEAEPDTLIPWLQYTHFTHDIAEYIWDSLLSQDRDTLEWCGNLARRWFEEVLPGGPAGSRHRFLFELRHEACFHDGRPVTAEDVVFSIQAAANPNLGWPLGSYFADVESCRAIDPYTVEVIYSHLYWMARKHLGELHILPRHIFDPDNLVVEHPEVFATALRKNPCNGQPVGSGPYRVVAWERGRELVLERWSSADPNGENAPRHIVFRFITDNGSALLALLADKVDMIPRLDAELFHAVQRYPEFTRSFQCTSYYTTYFDLIAWNLRRPFFRDKRVRQALACGAIDRRRFLETYMGNQGIPVTGSQYYFGPAYNHAVQPYPFDQRRAVHLLEEAGWADRDGDGIREKQGMKFKFRLILRAGNKLARDRAQVMRRTLEGLKIRMEICELESRDFWQVLKDRDYDACSMGWMVESESDPYQLWHSSQTGPSGSNLSCLEDPRVDMLVELSRSQLDEGKRHHLLHELHTLLHEEQPYLFFYCRPNLAVYSSRLQGVVFHTRRPGFRVDQCRVVQDSSQ